MSKNKIVYQNWIVELGYDPNLKNELNQLFDGLVSYSLDELVASGFNLKHENHSSNQAEKIKEAVGIALTKLNEEEQEFITRHYFMGESLAELSEKSNRELYKITAYHRRILNKLKKALTSFVAENFECDIKNEAICIICLSEAVEEINLLIKNRDRRKTWRPVLKILKEKYQINLRTPQIIIGHEKYHI